MLLLVYYDCVIITKPPSQPHVGGLVYVFFVFLFLSFVFSSLNLRVLP